MVHIWCAFGCIIIIKVHNYRLGKTKKIRTALIRHGHDRNATRLYANDFGARRIDEHTNKRVVNKVL